jgi:hypothetical protein
VTGSPAGIVAPGEPTRHPDDPDPVRSTKAGAVLALGLFAAVTGLFIGGVVPAVVALVLARQARRDLRAAQGYLTGSRAVRAGEQLAWLGIVLAIAVLTALAVRGIYVATRPDPPHDFAPEMN